MTKDEEDALVHKTQIEIIKHAIVEDGEQLQESAKNEVRLAIRAAVDAERERAARTCRYLAEGSDDYNIACTDCAAAILRGE